MRSVLKRSSSPLIGHAATVISALDTAVAARALGSAAKDASDAGTDHSGT